jgi:anti-anti-sigma factor
MGDLDARPAGYAVSARTPAHTEGLTLRCDDCGHRVAAGAITREWDTMWSLALEAGWTGSAQASGVHRCARCSGGLRVPQAGAGDPEARRRDWRAPVQGHGQTAVVRLHGELDVLVSGELRETLGRAGDEYRNLVLDLGDVPLVDSTTVGVLVRAHQAAKAKGGVICLAAPSRFIVAVLHTMRLGTLFPTFPDSRHAVEWADTRPE